MEQPEMTKLMECLDDRKPEQMGWEVFILFGGVR